MCINAGFKTAKGSVTSQYIPAEPEQASTTTVTMTDTFQQEFLKAHNDYRKKHNTPELSLNSELNASAQQWADHLMDIDTLQHSQCGHGENVYTMSSSTTITPKGNEAVDSWYSEIKDYDWSKPGFNGNTGHFTQVVWKDTTEVGVGIATSEHKVYVVGQYRPPGNMNTAEYFEENVLPLA